eukprot:gene31829-63114_t
MPTTATPSSYPAVPPSPSPTAAPLAPSLIGGGRRGPSPPHATPACDHVIISGLHWGPAGPPPRPPDPIPPPPPLPVAPLPVSVDGITVAPVPVTVDGVAGYFVADPAAAPPRQPPVVMPHAAAADPAPHSPPACGAAAVWMEARATP